MNKVVHMIINDEGKILHQYGAWTDYAKAYEYYESKIHSGSFSKYYSIEEIEVNE